MLVLLMVFSMLTYEVYKKGITQAPDEADPAWLDKGGDQALSTLGEIPSVEDGPVVQPGLGGSVQNSGTKPTGAPPVK